MDRKKLGIIIAVGGGLGLLAWLERDKFFINSAKLLSLDQLKAQVKASQQKAEAQGTVPEGVIHTVPIDGREQILFTTPEQEDAMGLASYKQVIAQNKVCEDQTINDIVQRVGWRLAAAAPGNNFNWQFTVLNSSTVNATCYPGGNVVVYTGILPWCQNEAALAAVLGHEIAHAIARHGGERLAETGIMQGVQTGISQTLKSMGLPPLTGSALSSFGSALELGLVWPFSRMQETEADDMGINYTAAAGYDPREAIDFWQRMIAATDNKSAILSDHPASADRMQDLENRLSAALDLYHSSEMFGPGDDLPTGC